MNRDRRKKEKAARLARNRATNRVNGGWEGAGQLPPPGPLPEVTLDQINISGVAPRGPKGSNGPRKLFVGGLSWDTDGQNLRTAFAPYGEIIEASVVMDRNTGKSRGFGFVTFRSPLEAAAAARALNGAFLDGRQMKVNPAEG